jgi:uncharacterized protein (TIRG00374 family)
MLAVLALGVVLLGVILYQTDLAEVWRQLQRLGWGGCLLLFAIFLAGFVALAGSWLVTLPSIAPNLPWLARFWRVLMVGSALAEVTPFAGMGGEPVKALLLKRHYGIYYRDATASLVLARMTDLIAQVSFMALGFALMSTTELPPSYRIGAAGGLALFSLAIPAFFLLQRPVVFSWLRGRLERGLLARRLGTRGIEALDTLRDVEQGLLDFYSQQRGRFALSVLLSLADWTSGAFATWAAVNWLGFPIGFADAMVIESFVVLIRSTLFFVPADLGTQEAALLLIGSAITGSASLGVALAAIRRARDVLWIFLGLAIGSAYSLSGRALMREAADAQHREAPD